jgi:hypothetical protein
VTIVLPAHPLRGRPLPLVRLVRVREGEGYADVEHPDGGPFRVPLGWTDRAAPWVVPQLGGRDVRLSVTGLQQLAMAVEAALDVKHDDADKSASTRPQHAERRAASDALAGVVEPRSAHAAGPARRMGIAGAQDPVRSGRRHGGNR